MARAQLVVTVVMAGGLGFACAQQTSSGSGSSRLLARYEGTLPCADCPGIRAQLSLYGTSSGAPATYELDQTYTERNRTLTEKGTWRIVRGSAANRGAVIYQLQPRQSNSRMNFIKAGKDQLQLLDADLVELPPSIPHTLTRVKER